MDKTASKNVAWVESPDGYLDRTPVLQFSMTSVLFAFYAIAASLNDILITQFKAVFDLSDMKTAFVQSAFYAGYFIVAIPASLFIKKTSYKIGIMTGLAFFALGCFIFFVDRISASYPLSKVRETRVLTVYMIIGCVILLGTAFILPRHRAVGRRPVLPD